MATTKQYRQVYVLGNKDQVGNREMKVVEAGEETDLPAAAEFYYTDVVAKFRYDHNDV